MEVNLCKLFGLLTWVIQTAAKTSGGHMMLSLSTALVHACAFSSGGAALWTALPRRGLQVLRSALGKGDRRNAMWTKRRFSLCGWKVHGKTEKQTVFWKILFTNSLQDDAGLGKKSCIVVSEQQRAAQHTCKLLSVCVASGELFSMFDFSWKTETLKTARKSLWL